MNDLIDAQKAEIARLRNALTTLKAQCNQHIKSINEGAGRATAGFEQINTLLKQCDVAFAVLDEPLPPA